MEAANVKLTMHGNFYPKSNIEKIYANRKENPWEKIQVWKSLQQNPKDSGTH